MKYILNSAFLLIGMSAFAASADSQSTEQQEYNEAIKEIQGWFLKNPVTKAVYVEYIMVPWTHSLIHNGRNQIIDAYKKGQVKDEQIVSLILEGERILDEWHTVNRTVLQLAPALRRDEMEMVLKVALLGRDAVIRSQDAFYDLNREKFLELVRKSRGNSKK